MMKIARLNSGPEIFFSIQGEGKSLGRPSVFVRSSLCNLHCVWCDTDYTWNWQGTTFRHERDQQPGYSKYDKQAQLVELSPDEIAGYVREHPCRNVVLTGGEPMLHQEGWVQIMLILRAVDSDYWFEVETNGTLVPTAAFDALINQYNVSPKTSNSGIEQRLREKSEALTFFASSPKATFKFVVSDPDDMEEILDLIRRYHIPRRSVYLMPEGTTTEVLAQRRDWLIDECKLHGFHLTDRLHVHLWGARRGV